MKNFLRKKIVKKTALYAVLIAASEFLRVYSIKKLQNESFGQMFAFAEILFAVLIAREFIRLIKKQADNPGEKIGAAVANLIKRLLKPIAKLLIDRYEHRDRLIYGVDERKFIFPKEWLEKLKKQADLREKIRIEDCGSNIETVRMLYVKLILGLKEQGRRIDDSSTPREIKEKLNSDENNGFFDKYEEVRYDKDADVDDSFVRQWKSQIK